MEPRMKTTNLLFYRRAEASVTLGHNTLTIRGTKKVFSEPLYEVLVDDGSVEKTVKARGSFMDAMGVLSRNPKTWKAAGRALGKVAEALDDESRDLRKSFTMAELVVLAGLDTGKDAGDLPKQVRLDASKVNDALVRLQKRGLIKVMDFAAVSLTPFGESVFRQLSEDPVFSRIVSALRKPPESKRPPR
ncbi:MAG: hypothetical protein U0R44_01705 [Candidatus Micrarchaeia archaeon]